MSDEIDLTTERSTFILDAKVAEVRRNAAEMPKGEPGECRLCGNESSRLVNGACAPCRDKHGLP